MLNKEQIKCMAQDQGWEVLFEYPEQNQMRFVRNEKRIDIWCSPKKGVTVAIMNQGKIKYHKFVSEKLLDELLTKPI